eukprot:1467034-Amphidinium_carterae.1
MNVWWRERALSLKLPGIFRREPTLFWRPEGADVLFKMTQCLECVTYSFGEPMVVEVITERKSVDRH